MRLADRFGSGLAEAEVLHLARVDQLLDGPRDRLDGYLRVDAVLVEDVDVIHAEVVQAVVGDLADGVGPAVEGAADLLGRHGHVDTELGGQDHVVAEVPDRLADQDLVGSGAPAVHLGGVEEGDAQGVGAAEGGDAGRLAGGSVGHRQAHRAVADRRDLKALPSERPVLHGALL